jgi:hypothetical protein
VQSCKKPDLRFRATVLDVAQVHEKAKVSQFRRQVVFRIGEEDWPYLEAAAKEHGSIQAGIIAALRAQAVRRLAPEAEATPTDVSPTPEVAVPARVEEPRRSSARSKVESHGARAACSTAQDTVELNVAEAAPVLGLQPDSLRAAIKRGARPGRRSETGFYLASVERETLRRANPALTLRGAAEVVGRKPETLRRHCREGCYPNASNDGTGWRIPALDLL